MQPLHFMRFIRFYPAKHTTLILSKARNIPEKALVGRLTRRDDGALVFMEFLGTDSWFLAKWSWGNSDGAHVNIKPWAPIKSRVGCCRWSQDVELERVLKCRGFNKLNCYFSVRLKTCYHWSHEVFGCSAIWGLVLKTDHPTIEYRPSSLLSIFCSVWSSAEEGGIVWCTNT